MRKQQQNEGLFGGSFAEVLRRVAETDTTLTTVFDEEPVSLTVFVQDRAYLGNPPLSTVQYDAVRHIERIYYPETYPQLAAVFDAGKKDRAFIGPASAWREEPYWSQPCRMCNFATLQWGKGSGKDHICRIASMRIAYLLLCLRSPQAYYGMPEQDTIHLLNVASSSQQAQQAFFMPIVRAVRRKGNWFENRCEPRQNTVTYAKHVESVSGHSDAETQEGLNLMLGIADEIDAFKTKAETATRRGASAREPTKSAEGILEMMRTSGAPQPLDAQVLTPDRGFVRMGELCVGDRLVDPIDGFASQVVAIHPQGVNPVYRVEFSDGTSAEATAEHLWSMNKLRSPRTVAERRIKNSELRSELWTTETLAAHLHTPHYAQKAVSLPDTVLHTVDLGSGADLPIDPYLLGLLLGDGGLTHYSPTFTTSDEELRDRCAAVLPPGVRMTLAGSRSPGCYSYRLVRGKGRRNPVTEALRDLDVWNKLSHEKFIPRPFLLTAAKDRLALLQGLMDTDGYARRRAAAQFSSTSRQLRDDVAWLARSLGLRVYCSGKAAGATSKGTRRNYLAAIRETDDVRIFRLTRKTVLYESAKASRRTVRAVTYARDTETQCIEVSAPSCLYLTDDFIPTHNTRFPEVYKNVRISFPRYKGSTIQRLTAEGLEDIEENGIDSRHYVSGPLATWDVNPRVPGKEAFRQDYKDDPVMARSKYECRPARAANPYFRNRAAVDDCFTPRVNNPIDVAYGIEGDGQRKVWVPRYTFAEDLYAVRGARYAMHADLAVTADRAGIAMAHVARWDETETVVEDNDGAEHTMREVRPVVVVDFVISYSADIGADPPREIQIRWARQLCFDLIRRGFPIVSFTFDGYQSTDSMQILEARGIETDKLSTDMSEDPWRTLRDVMYEGRLSIPAPAGFDRRDDPEPFLLRDELYGLTRAPNGKIDHPSDGSKDLADALACAVVGAIALGGEEEPSRPRSYFTEPDIHVGTALPMPFGMRARDVWETSRESALESPFTAPFTDTPYGF